MGKHLSSVLETEGCQRIENRICDFPDHLLVLILLFVPTKDAVATSILSKRWRYVWTMLPDLVFMDEGSDRFAWFINKSLQLHKAPKLETLITEIGPGCRVDVDVREWVENAVNRGVEELDFTLLWKAEPTSFPKSLYTCKTLVRLSLSNKILVDVSSLACLPSLIGLSLLYVVYKDEDSLARLLSSSPVLKYLMVLRHKDDNLKNFTVKVSSLQTLYYAWKEEDNEEEEEEDDNEEEEEEEEEEDDLIGSLVIDSPALTYLRLFDVWEDCLIIEHMACLNEAFIGVHNPDDKFLRSLSSTIHLYLNLTQSKVVWFNAIEFSRLIEIYLSCLDESVDWLKPLMFLLQNSPKLKSLTIKINAINGALWNQPSSIPGCFSSHLEIFVWFGYGGREDDKQLLTYILAHSKCLKTVEIYFKPTCNLEERRKEIESMPRISTSSRLLFPTEVVWRFNGSNILLTDC